MWVHGQWRKRYGSDIHVHVSIYLRAPLLTMWLNKNSRHCCSHSPLDPTAGNVVNIWRLYPHTQEALSLMMSFRITSCPSLMVASRERLCIACNDHIMGSYSLDMYSLTEQSEQAATCTCVYMYNLLPT